MQGRPRGQLCRDGAAGPDRGQAQQDGFTLIRQGPRRRAHRGTERREGLTGTRVQVVHHQRDIGLEQPSRHGATHVADTDETDVQSPKGKEALQHRLTQAINKVLTETEGFGGVDAVYFKNFIIQ